MAQISKISISISYVMKKLFYVAAERTFSSLLGVLSVSGVM